MEKTIRLFGESKGVDFALIMSGSIPENNCRAVFDFLESNTDEYFADFKITGKEPGFMKRWTKYYIEGYGGDAGPENYLALVNN